MNPLDSQIVEWVKKLGLNATVQPTVGQEAFRVSISPPTGFPVVDIIRPSKEADFYIVIMGIAIAQQHQDALRALSPEQRADFLLDLQMELTKFEVDMAFIPPGVDVPQAIQVSRVLFTDDLNVTSFFNTFYKVRNAGLYVLLAFNKKFKEPVPGGRTYM